MSYQVKPFDLSGVQGLSKKAVDTHLGLYKGYVEQLNKVLEQQPAAATAPLGLDGYARRFAFEFNGVMLHEAFFEQLAGKQRGEGSDSSFANALKEHGGFAAWKSSIEALAKTRGIGWVLTVQQRGNPKLHNVWVDLHHVHFPAQCEVVFALDLWEHAFLLDFAPSQKADYVKIVLDNVDWTVPEKRFRALSAPR